MTSAPLARGADEGWRRLATPHLSRQLGALWGKSNVGDGPILLLQHLFDAMAVADLMWDHFLAPGVRVRLDRVAGGDGRRLFRWLCGLHDIGKATPVFQGQVPDLARAVEATGLRCTSSNARERRSARHDRAGAHVVRRRLSEVWKGEAKHVEWIWPLIGGHHGSVPSLGDLRKAANARISSPDEWATVQLVLLEIITTTAGYESVEAADPQGTPSKSEQLVICGLVMMADWIASGQHFDAVATIDDVGVSRAVDRASHAWLALGLGGGWRSLVDPPPSVIFDRFGWPSRPSQDLIVAAAREMESPGLLILEAPMGEGKTEGALAAAEVLAYRFGADGIFVGMPTQATANPMFLRVMAWLRSLDEQIPIALLHGKSSLNEDWRKVIESGMRGVVDPQPAGTDEYGCQIDNVLEDVGADDCTDQLAPSEWLLGRHRRLLTPVVVATVDQLLLAAAQVRHVMLRHAGLAGKVVILDEVHAVDVYMSQFLGEALWWLGQAKVPVILLSATLAPQQRRSLVQSYLAGAEGRPTTDVASLPAAVGYPSVTAAWKGEAGPEWSVHNAEPWRPTCSTTIELLPEVVGGLDGEHAANVARLVEQELVDGGCALVIHNTVKRAQQTFSALRERMDQDEVALLHGRFSVRDRSERTSWILERLGPAPDAGRPRRLVVVATQIAEQSFDIDADLLITDLAPVDLLAQRAGRLHRHERQSTDRPPRLRTRRIVVTGFDPTAAPVPAFPRASEAIYGRHLLLRTAGVVVSAANDGWSIPADVPRLVGEVYGDEDILPGEWSEPAADARAEWEAKCEKRAYVARASLLTSAGAYATSTIEGLHRDRGIVTGDHVRVRDGDSSVEVVLVRRVDGVLRALDETYLGANGENARDEVPAVLSGTVRLPAWPEEMAKAAERLPKKEWHDHPWLSRVNVLVLDEDGIADLGGYRVAYDSVLGLVIDDVQGMRAR